MADKNDITGSSLVTKPTTDQYREGWDGVFSKKNPHVWVLGEPATQIHQDEPSGVVSDMSPHCCGCCGDEC